MILFKIHKGGRDIKCLCCTNTFRVLWNTKDKLPVMGKHSILCPVCGVTLKFEVVPSVKYISEHKTRQRYRHKESVRCPSCGSTNTISCIWNELNLINTDPNFIIMKCKSCKISWRRKAFT